MASPAQLNSKTVQPMENCSRYCDGYDYREMKRCPLDGPDCPFHRPRLLQPIGFGERYWDATIEQISGQNARESIQTYIDAIDEAITAGRGLYVQGGVGSGKTCILTLVGYAAAAADASLKIEYWYAGELFDHLHRGDQDAIDKAYYCDLLLLDDFGVQYAIDWTVTRFDALVEYRYAHRKAMCVTTNVGREELRADDRWRRVYDRWKEMCEGISAGKESMRGSQ